MNGDSLVEDWDDTGRPLMWGLFAAAALVSLGPIRASTECELEESAAATAARDADDMVKLFEKRFIKKEKK